MPARSIVACLLPLLMIAAMRPAAESRADAGSVPFLYTTAKQYDALAWMRGGERFPAGSAILFHDGKGDRPLAAGFAAAADASVSFDGQRIVFSGKKSPADPWQIWEIVLGDRDARRVTSGPEDCIRPFYLPEDRVVYGRKVSGRFVIEVMDLAGGKPLALTYGPANFMPTDVLHDGRILFEAGYPLGSKGAPEVYTVYSDGSGIESYRCDHGKARDEGKQLASGDIVFASSLTLARFTSARAQAIPIAIPRGEYAGDVAEMPSGDWLIPWRPDAKAHFQLALWTPGAATLRSVVIEHDADAVQPILVGERAVPKRHPSGLHDWPNANLLCLNAYASKYKFAPGSIRSVRLYTRDAAGSVTLLGTALVERDGSFFVQVPTEQALQIELLDASGKTLKREDGFFWMRRGEQRGCVGCHAGPETAPENAVPLVLLKSTTPADMTGAAPHNPAGGN